MCGPILSLNIFFYRAVSGFKVRHTILQHKELPMKTDVEIECTAHICKEDEPLSALSRIPFVGDF